MSSTIRFFSLSIIKHCIHTYIWGKSCAIYSGTKKATTRSCGELWLVEGCPIITPPPTTTHHIDKLWFFLCHFMWHWKDSIYGIHWKLQNVVLILWIIASTGHHKFNILTWSQSIAVCINGQKRSIDLKRNPFLTAFNHIWQHFQTPISVVWDIDIS